MCVSVVARFAKGKRLELPNTKVGCYRQPHIATRRDEVVRRESSELRHETTAEKYQPGKTRKNTRRFQAPLRLCGSMAPLCVGCQYTVLERRLCGAF